MGVSGEGSKCIILTYFLNIIKQWIKWHGTISINIKWDSEIEYEVQVYKWTEYIKILLAIVAVKRTMTSLSWRPASHIGRLWKSDHMWVCFTISMFRSSVLKVKKLNFYSWIQGSERMISTSSRNASWWNQDYYLHVKWNIQGIWWVQLSAEESNSFTFLGH